MGQKPQIKRAIVLLNLGGPTSLAEVKPFLFSLFYDRAIISLPNPFRWMLAKFISSQRFKEAQHIYETLGGKSPLYEETQKQAKALSELVDCETRVFIAMRHATPLTETVFEEVRQLNPEEVVLLPLYPQYSTTTTGSALQKWRDLEEKFNWRPKTRAICCYPTLDGLIDPIVERIQEAYLSAQKSGRPKLILSAHGLPEKVIQGGDPYQAQVEATAHAIVRKLHISGLDWSLAYQSRVGPLPWIRPFTEDILSSAASLKQPIVMVPIAFVSEHSETLYELDHLYGKLAKEKGAPEYYRIPTVSIDPRFIKGLYSLVEADSHKAPCGNKFKNCGRNQCPQYCEQVKQLLPEAVGF